ncbi:MAG: heme exporter protein CcmB [Alphaproteobacteria bacterium]|jgi:heme exporter protein B|nr:heme exporter protein CcmB [Alphaproteobacteria bacterium]MBT4085412.1 heme exporter protein CcmB [Alphaproteobacteria bacterium]MBT4544510.1 heme exporter protein CcmB [Alphaproteobacteria bacterium]
MNRFFSLVRRDVALAFRQGSASTMVVMFFILTVTLFPLGVGPEANILQRISSGVLWVAAMLASMLSLDRLFQADFEDGSLDLLTLGSLPLEVTVLAKCLAHWLTTGLPLIIIAPLLGVLLHLETSGYVTLLISMLLGTPTLSLIGAIGAALTVGVRRGGVLLSLLVIPLYIPILIFGVGSIDAAIGGLTERPHLFVLGAMLLGSVALCPWAAAAALKLNLE